MRIKECDNMEKKERENIENNGSPAGKEAAPSNNTPNNDTKNQNIVDIPSFGEIYTEKRFEDTELLTDYKDREIIIHKYDTGEGSYGPYILLTISLDGHDTRVARTSSLVIIDQVTKIGDRLPIKTTPIEKNGQNGKKFLTLS